MFNKRKSFTLVELLIVIVVIGILSSIVFNEVSYWQDRARLTAIQGNERTVQTALDMYQLKNLGQHPTSIQPTKENPRAIEFDKLEVEYLRQTPKHLLDYHWVDFEGKFWQSTLDSPRNVANVDGKVTWDFVRNAKEYSIYRIEGNSKKFLAKTPSTTYTDSKYKAGDTYLVSVTDIYGFETAPVGKGYHGFEPSYSLKLNGVNQYVMIPNAPQYQFGTGDFSYSLKFKTDNIPSGIYQLFEKRVNYGGGSNFEVQLHSQGQIVSYTRNDSSVVSAPNVVQPNQIYEVTVVRKSGVVTVYLDGNQIASGTSPYNVSTNENLYIGRDHHVGEYMKGAIFSVKIWNRGLDSTEVVGLKDREFIGNENGLVGYWKLSEGEGSIIYDHSTYKNNGTIFNNAVWEMQ